jgi:uncharacterized protein (TIGR02145 family)
MHKLVSIIFLFSVGCLFSQSIENVDFRAEGKTIVVTYDFFHPKADTAINVDLVFKDQKGVVLNPKTITGAIKNVKPGESKRIVWEVLSDGIILSGKYKAFVIIQKSLPVTLKSVVIGSQTWTTENLNVDHFRNGDSIPEAKTSIKWKKAGKKKQPAWCYYDNNPKNGDRYGKLYNCYAVNDDRGLAPLGWHVPSDLEWTILSSYLGGEDVAGKSMKSSSGWRETNSITYNSGSNNSGFSGLPGGQRISGKFYSVGDYGSWWSASDGNDSNAWSRGLSSYYSDFYRRYGGKSNGFSIRCIKD